MLDSTRMGEPCGLAHPCRMSVPVPVPVLLLVLVLLLVAISVFMAIAILVAVSVLVAVAAVLPVRGDDLEDRPRRAGRPEHLRRGDVDVALGVVPEALHDVAEALRSSDQQLVDRPQPVTLLR